MLDIVYPNTVHRRAAGGRAFLPHMPVPSRRTGAGIPLYGIDPENHFSWNRDFCRNAHSEQLISRAEHRRE
jgi:hypothetical protein